MVCTETTSLISPLLHTSPAMDHTSRHFNKVYALSIIYNNYTKRGKVFVFAKAFVVHGNQIKISVTYDTTTI